MEKKKRRFVGITLLFTTFGIVTLMMSLGTDYWVCVQPKLLAGDENTTSVHRYKGSIHYGLFRGGILLNYGLGDRLSDIVDYWVQVTPELRPANRTGNSTISIGSIYFGLFSGQSILNFGLGQRLVKITVSRDINEMNLMDYSLWITVVVLHLLAIVWALLAAGFTLYNLFGKPIETITGPFGLYVWNSCAGIFTLLSIVIFLTLFKTSIYDKNILKDADIEVGWKSIGLSQVGWSFYLNLGALGCFILNILLLKFSDVIPCVPAFSSKSKKPVDDGFIY